VLPVVIYTGSTAWGSNRTLVDLLGEPQALHAFAPVWQPLFWNLAEQSPEELLASDNTWLQMMAVLRVKDADAATFREVFTQAVHQVKTIKGAEHVRWYDLMRTLLTWVFWRRPEAERPTLLAEAEKAQAGVKRQGEIQQMTNKLGPSFWDLALENAMEKARQEVKEEVMEKARQEVKVFSKLQALREMLASWLQDKFGRLPKKLQKQIEATTDAEQLRQAIRRIPKCSSLTDFQL